MARGKAMRALWCLCWCVGAAGAAESVRAVPAAPAAGAPAPLSLEAQRLVQQREVEFEGLVQLLGVRRIYVDKLTGGATADQMRDLLMASLRESRLFVITENPDRADAILRGAAEDLIYNEHHQSSDGIDARASFNVGRRTTGVRASGLGAAAGVGERESLEVTERRHEAMAAVRLVNRDGDVIWATTQESKGAKFRGAGADVADKIARRLAEDYERARRLKR